jgi:hypothetical protein
MPSFHAWGRGSPLTTSFQSSSTGTLHLLQCISELLHSHFAQSWILRSGKARHQPHSCFFTKDVPFMSRLLLRLSLSLVLKNFATENLSVVPYS